MQSKNSAPRSPQVMRLACEGLFLLVIAAAFLTGLTSRTSGSPLPWYYGGSGSQTIFVSIGESIQDAIDEAMDGWTIQLAYGVHYGDNLSTQGKRVRIRGALQPSGWGYNVRVSQIRPLGKNRVFDISQGEGPETILQDLIIRGGSVSGFTPYGESTIEIGGGIRINSSSPTIRNCEIKANTADLGGGIGLIGSSQPTIEDCQIRGNIAELGGGIGSIENSSPLITRTRIFKNTAQGSSGEDNVGGGIFSDSTVDAVLEDAVICQNTPDQIVGEYVDAGEVCISPTCDVDCNQNGICDAIELAEGSVLDCDGNGVIDACQFEGVLVESRDDPDLPPCWDEGVSAPLPMLRSDSVVEIEVRFTSPAAGDPDWCVDTYESLSFSLESENGGGYVYLGTVYSAFCSPTEYVFTVNRNQWNDLLSDGTAPRIHFYRQCEYCYEEAPCRDLSIDVTYTGLANSAPDADGDGAFDCVDPCPDIPFDCDGDPSTIDVAPGMDIASIISAFPDATRFDLAPGSYPISRFIEFGDRDIVIRGSTNADGSPSTVLDGHDATSIIYCVGVGAIFENLVFYRGQQSVGVGLWSNPVFRNCHFIDNTSNAGSAVSCYGGFPLFEDCRFEGNRSSYSGGAVYSQQGRLRFSSCEFLDNASQYGGGGAVSGNDSEIDFIDCVFRENGVSNSAGSPDESGGGVFFAGGRMLVSGCLFEGNTAPMGSAIHVTNAWCGLQPNSEVEIVDSELRFNSGKVGGGIAVTNLNSIDCTAKIEVDVVVRDSIIEQNQGQGIFVLGTPAIDPQDCRLSIRGSQIRSNFGYRDGGGLHVTDAVVAVESSIVDSNFAMYGGGIMVDGQGRLELVDCEIQGNVATQGGGLFTFGYAETTMQQTLVCRNTPNQIFGSYGDLGDNCIGELCADTDSDGTLDCLDGCPEDPEKVDPGTCGCGVADIDSDEDSTPDCFDECPTDPSKIEAGTCGCGVSDEDSDSDGLPDCIDPCPSWPYDCSPDGTEFLVDPGESIALAVSGVPTGGTIRLTPGRHPVDTPVDPLGRAITIAGTLDADGEPLVTVDAEQSGSAIVIQSGEGPTTMIRDLTFTGGSSVLGGGMLLNGTNPRIVNCRIRLNAAQLGGGIYCSAGSAPILEDCRIENNTAIDGGGGLFVSASSLPELVGTTVCGNAPDQIFGPYASDPGSCEESTCENCLSICPEDLNSDGEVNGADLGLFLVAWGSCSGPCPEDFNGDGQVDGSDLGFFLLAVGPCDGD